MDNGNEKRGNSDVACRNEIGGGEAKKAMILNTLPIE